MSSKGKSKTDGTKTQQAGRRTRKTARNERTEEEKKKKGIGKKRKNSKRESLMYYGVSTSKMDRMKSIPYAKYAKILELSSSGRLVRFKKDAKLVLERLMMIMHNKICFECKSISNMEGAYTMQERDFYTRVRLFYPPFVQEEIIETCRIPLRSYIDSKEN